MKIPVEVSEETLLQLKDLNAKEGCPDRSDLELLSDLIRNIVDLTHEAFIAEERGSIAAAEENTAQPREFRKGARNSNNVVSFPSFSKTA